MFSINLVKLTLLSLSGLKVDANVSDPTTTPLGSLGPPHLSPNAIPPTALTVPWEDLQEHTTTFSLLSWHTRVSQFAGRQQEMEHLTQWATSRQAISVKFITGEGGVGKSRLAAEFATTLQRQDWTAGFVDLRKPQAFPLRQAGTLLVIDYPEEHREGVLELLRDLSHCGREHHLRVLFLTRQRLDDWHDLIRESRAQNLIEQHVLPLGELDSQAAYTLFCTAQEHAAETCQTVPLPVSEEALTAWLALTPEHERALFVVGAAVQSALQPKEEVVRYNSAEIITALVERELDRLRQIAIDQQWTDSYSLARLVAMAAIAERLPLAKLATITEHSNFLTGLPQAGNIQEAIEQTGLLTDHAISAPKPDIVAASFVIRVLGHRPGAAPEMVWMALEDDVAGSLERLARLSHDAEVVLGLHTHRLSVWLAKAVAGKPERCHGLEEFMSLPLVPSGWVEAGISTWQTLLEEADNNEKRAEILNHLGMRLSDAGRHAEALTRSKEAVRLRRQLAHANPSRYESDLVTSLNNLTNRLSDMGENAEALAKCEEAVKVGRRLASTNSIRYQRGLATILNNLSACLARMGQHEEAFAASEESVDISRRLAEANPGQYEHELAQAINNLANRFYYAGKYAEALTTGEESVELYRQLAKANSALYEPDLAFGLGNLAVRFSNVGKDTEARDASEESVEIYHRLAQANPNRYERELALSLNGFATHLSLAGNYKDALAKSEESVTIRRRLAQANPTRYERDLASSLHNQSIHLTKVGRDAEALARSKEATEIDRRLARTNPAQHEPNLAQALSGLAEDFHNAGRDAEALTNCEESIEIYRRLVRASPNRFETGLADSLHTFGQVLSRLNRDEEAVKAFEEGLSFIRPRVGPQSKSTFARLLSELESNLESVKKKLKE